ncbi:hypothetical protein E3C22_16675 [Jiella endophytica]|uniref:Uncharacterized protein n=1 Tax=Jiella endophytica TaxID=2558362 RepID=A0A4Y8RE16_9HYPH|nr:hypothetical protein [Jiella endophytica]TFF20542.1 hypothetical protein E3C22_16675 [Jiella endophytica]
MAQFVLAETYRYPWPVTVHVPDPAKAGATIEQTFEALFEAVSLDEAEAMNADYLALKTDAERSAHQHDFLKRALKGWSGVQGPGGAEVPFTDETFATALQHAWFRQGVYRAYSQSLSGEARTGN